MAAVRYVLALCLAALALPVLAQPAAAPAPTPQLDISAPARQSAPVTLANRTIIVLRGPIAGYSAQERGAAAKRRIDEALATNESPSVTMADEEDGTRVLLDGKTAFLVTRIDIDPQIGETTQNVAREAAKRLQRAITEYREQRTLRYLLTQVGWALLATVIYAGLVRLLFLIDRLLGRRIAGAAAERAERVHVHGVSLLDPQQIRWIARRAVNLAAWVLALFATYSWLTFVLERFPFTRPWGEHMEGNLFSLAGQIALAIVGAVPGLVVVVVIMLLAHLVIRLSNLFFQRVEAGSITLGTLDADTVVPTRRIFQVIVWAFALALAYPYLPGSDTDAFKGVSVLVGLMVSIGASGLVGQAASGLILMYTRAFRAGEYVRIGDTEGTVMALGAFATRMRTGLGEEVLLPNSFVLQNTTNNYSRAIQGAGFVVHTGVTIGYSTPWRQVHAMLEEAARRTRDIVTDPPPYVRQTKLSDFYVEYRLIGYATIDHPDQRIDMLSRLHANIQDVFNEHGVQIMSPHYMTETAEPQVVPKAKWWTAPAQPPKVGDESKSG
jgi:small-conductance mechanosensitive channel